MLDIAVTDAGSAHLQIHSGRAKIIAETYGLLKKYPELFNSYDVASFSSYKSPDTLDYTNNIINGTKFWISFLNLSKFVILITKNQEFLFVPINQQSAPMCDSILIESQQMNPLGLESAAPYKMIFDNYLITSDQICGKITDEKNFISNNFIMYGFITMNLGCAIGLLQDIKNLCSVNDRILKEADFDIGVLKQMWLDNLHSINVTEPSDALWHTRHTMYTYSKKLLKILINIVIDEGNSRFMDKFDKQSQKFRDAVVLSSHTYSFGKSVIESHFTKQYTNTKLF